MFYIEKESETKTKKYTMKHILVHCNNKRVWENRYYSATYLNEAGEYLYSEVIIYKAEGWE